MSEVNECPKCGNEFVRRTYIDPVDYENEIPDKKGAYYVHEARQVGDQIMEVVNQCHVAETIDGDPLPIDEMVEMMDEDTCLRVQFPVSHTAYYLYRFPSGIVAGVWGDPEIRTTDLRLTSTYIKRKIDDADESQVRVVPFEETPYAENFVEEEYLDGC